MSSTSSRPLGVAKPAIDPRLNARRVEVLRSQGRRRLRVMGSLGGVATLAVAAWGLVQSPLLDIDHVRVQPLVEASPNLHVEARTIEQASGLRRGDPLFNRDLSAVRRRVLDVPWVADVEVTREWPGTVVISVGERVPMVVVPKTGQGWMLVDREGRALEAVRDVPAGIVPVGGVKPVDEPGRVLGSDGRGALALVGAIPVGLRPQVIRIDVAADGSLAAFLRLVDGEDEVEVRFGPPVDLEVKALDLATLLADVEIRGVAVVDVRVPGTPVVVRRP